MVSSNGDAVLIACLIDRLVTRLPHRTGTNGQDLLQDDLVSLSRSTAIRVSTGNLPLVLESILPHIEDLTTSYNSISKHPPHVLLSVRFLLSLAADCCSIHWGSNHPKSDSLISGEDDNAASRSRDSSTVDPSPLGDGIVVRFLDVLRCLLDPLPEGFILPTRMILEDTMPRDPESGVAPLIFTTTKGHGHSAQLDTESSQIEADIRVIVEYITSSNWSSSFEYFRKVLYILRPAAPQSQINQAQPLLISDEESHALAFLRLLAFFWVNGQKLGLILQEICSSFLHFRKQFQNNVSLTTSLLITRWIDRFPSSFVELHNQRKRLDGGADTIFDMTQAAIDNGRRKAVIYPLQTALLFLIPDVFEVASNLRQVKSTSMSKKVAFLDALRKSLRNRNEHACYCLVSLLRVARHFDAESDAALMGFAMDVQDEVRDAVFRRFPAGVDAPIFEQDMMTAAFVSISQLNLDSSVDSLIQACLAPSAPLSFKKAVVQGCYYFAKQNNSAKYEQIFAAAGPFMQKQLEVAATFDPSSPQGRQASPATSEINPSVAIACDILRFLDTCPSLLFEAASQDIEDLADSHIFEWFLLCMTSPDDEILRQTCNVVRRLFSNPSTADKLKVLQRSRSLALKEEFWGRSTLILSSMANKIAHNPSNSGLSDIKNYLEARVLLLTSIPEPARLHDEINDLSSVASKVETALLVSLCSADLETCEQVTTCIRYFLRECTILETSLTSAKQVASMLRNSVVFHELASRDFRLTGLVAFQKRVRSLLRRLQYPTSGILYAWELAFEKWVTLSREISTSLSISLESQTLAEWRNFSGFLASLGGICTTAQATSLEEPTISGLRWIDRLSSENHEEPLLTRYLRLSIRLLACSDVRVREATREILTTEVSPALFQPLFRALESELEILFAGSLALSESGRDIEVIFAEQTASLLRGLIERLDTPADLGAASSVHLGALTLDFARFLDSLNETTAVQRVKIKVCHLCEAVTKRKEYLNLRDDVRIRNQLLESIFGWLADPRGTRHDTGSQVRPDESLRIQRDLDKACLRALAELTLRLPLQPAEGQSDAGASELKSQMFLQYFTRFLSLLNHETSELGTKEIPQPVVALRDEGGSTPELTIIILSNLLSANIDVGLKHSLNIGYHENIEIRTAFVKVLYNILIQGTEFGNLSDTVVSEKYEELLELLTRDVPLAAAMGAVCPSSEVDELTVSLLTIFEQRGLSFHLLEALVKHEVDNTENESELLRRNCVATKMLSIYAKWKGASYLKSTLQKVVERLMLTSNDLDLELDPARVSSPDELQKNALQLRIVAKVFIDDICSSTANMPPSFRKICSIISTAVLPRFQEAKYTAVGAFIFLRFFCPAIVAPEVEGLVTTTPSKEMRRGLLLIAKVIQNLANNVLFGAKEPYMFSLNDFLTQNIYKVTTFLREISVPPSHPEKHAEVESFDFGSCVSIHRFLYDHWDHVQQRLTSLERREYVRSPGDASRGRSPVLEPLRNLITNLGPPPLAVTWNRPQISANTLPIYSRFQNFMLRNASRGMESFLTARAVYDGGESKDGLSIVCVILRHIDAENIDYDTILYCYLKIASRLWQRPFGLLIDATCYGGNTEPQDDLFKKLELLAPTELSRSLSRVYVYNMNNAFRKCFRRMLRVSSKSSNSLFHPKNVEYHLVGSLQELQTHFHLSQLNLPPETISVVTDTRYVFQPITRLSKTKGKIEVIIKVGSQFVQVTTANTTEVFPGFRLYTTVNDIFRLGDIDEAQTSIQTEDDSAFGLRADNGKIIMYFTSPQKIDILQSIRAAKAKYGKDNRSHKALDRLIRPQDVPGTLLNLAFANVSSPNSALRCSSYNLLGALCRAFNFNSASRLMCSKALCIPSDPSAFVISMSEHLARTEPQLTYDFLTEFFVGWDSFSDDQKPFSLSYMAPWLTGLRTFVLVAETDAEKGRDKIAVIFRKLIEVILADHSQAYIIGQAVWSVISTDDLLSEILLDELVKMDVPFRPHDGKFDVLCSIVAAIGSISLRGKVISRLRKALNRSSLRPTKLITENAVWSEIRLLLQFCLSLSFDSGVQVQLYVPEIFHIATMLANTGPMEFRCSVQRLLVNSIHSMCTSFPLEEHRLSKLRGILDILSDLRGDLFSNRVVLGRDENSTSSDQESNQNLAATESLATLLFDVCATAAPATDLSNSWRSRWMSLVASTAFQNNPAIQPRAFAVMGCLAREEVDDDLLYQVLVALRSSVARFGEEGNSEMLVSILTSLSRMLSKLRTASRYGIQLFWLAISILRLVPAALFNCAAQFLEAVLANTSTISELKGEKMCFTLMQGRSSLEEAAESLDELYGVRFSQENFHFAVCSCLARGLTDTISRPIALRVLSAFLGMSRTSSTGEPLEIDEISNSPYFALILARTSSREELKDHLWFAGVNTTSLHVSPLADIRDLQDVAAVKDKDLLLNTTIELVDFQYLEDTVQIRTLQWLNKLSSTRPGVLQHLQEPIISILDDLLMHSQNSAALECAYSLLQALSLSMGIYQVGEKPRSLVEIFEELGFRGLWHMCSLNKVWEPDLLYFTLTEKLIKLIIL